MSMLNALRTEKQDQNGPSIDICTIPTLYGLEMEDMPQEVRDVASEFDGKVQYLSESETHNTILHILKKLPQKGMSRSREENKQAFENGWSENLEDCRQFGLTWKTLQPRYCKPLETIIYNGRFAKPHDPFIIDKLLLTSVASSFKKYLTESENVYEFGCGTGRFLHLMAKMFPQKHLFGLDWTDAAIEILDLMRDAGINVSGKKFDMLNPDYDFNLEPDSAVVTIGSLEQLGENFDKCLEYILSSRPKVAIHHEPIVDFYSEDNLSDYLQVLYHHARGYLKGYYKELKRLEDKGIIEILDAKRMHYGNVYHEYSSFIAWRPK